MDRTIPSGPFVAAVALIGFGMGGFVDAIVLHMILQWHQMISNILPPDTLLRKSVNMFWDGIFCAITWVMTGTGLVLFWRQACRGPLPGSGKLFWGSLLLGWGLFNLLDSLVDHYLFGFHNVRENVENPEAWNAGFLFFAISQVLTGWVLVQAARRNKPARPGG
jgi:uncharacterized membrane protein